MLNEVLTFLAVLSPSSDYIFPNPDLTPGVFCTEDDPDFYEYRYREEIPYCKRRLSKSQKIKVMNAYNYPEDTMGDYELDHCIPLSLGGSNNLKNIWPQPRDAINSEAKNKVAFELYNGLSKGTITYEYAVTVIRKWCPER